MACLAYRSLLLPVLCIVLTSWQNKPPLFRLLPAAQTGVTFRNTITETDQLNILNEAYIYNGGGIGIGDFNKDGLQDLYFAGNMVSNKLYLNKGGLKFQDITLPAGVAGAGRWCMGVSVVDINNDGWPDIYVSASFLKDEAKRKNLLYINQGVNKQGIPIFKESAAAFGIDDDGYSSQGVFFDYDRDGDLDLYVLTNSLDDPKTPIQFRPKVTDGSAVNTDRLYRNNGNNTFTNVSQAAGITIEGWGHAVSVSDINLDGWPDIYVSNDFNANDIFYVNNGDGTFTDRIGDYFRHTSWYTMGTDIVDINNDGYVDVVALDMLPETNLRKKGMLIGNEYYNYFNARKYGYQHQYIRNVLQVNSGPIPGGHPVFSDLGILAGIYQTDWSWAPLVSDFDNDGFRDLVVTNGLPRDVTDLDYIAYDNKQGPGATNTSLKLVDQLPVVRISNYAFRNEGGLTFSNTTKTWGLNQASYSNGGAYADLDNDGDMDLVMNNINSTAFLFENTLMNPSADMRWLRVTFDGSAANPGAHGATLRLYHDSGRQQFYEHQPCRGYLSTVDPRAFFGLGKTRVIDSLIVTWPDGASQKLIDVKANQSLQLSHKNASPSPRHIPSMQSPLMKEVSGTAGLSYLHEERDAVDYNIQPTIPHKLSQYGPGLAIGDIDHNGYEDIYIGGAAGHPGFFFLQHAPGQFTRDTQRIIQEDNTRTEENGVLLFDADNDNDPDLYVVGGSYEFAPNHPGNQDRLYINDGKGKFRWNRAALPVETANGSCVRAADFDRDGDLDLFVGGRSVSGSYPLPPRNFLLENVGGVFVDVTRKYCAALEHIGMISDALWSDFDQDGQVDLVLAGEWMPVTFLKNNGTSFTPHTSGIDSLTGWWNSLVAGDFDNDGDIDYAAGNLGLNSIFQGTTKEPMTLLAKDVDDNGKVDVMVFCYMKAEDGSRKLFPVHTKDDLSSQLISIRKKYPTYRSYGLASVNELWTVQQRREAIVMQVNETRSCYIENKGNGRFALTPLPLEAQAAPVFGMVCKDVNQDGNLDLLLVGNDYGMEPGSGRHDALHGLYLQGDGKGTFQPVSVEGSGFFVPGDGKAFASMPWRESGELLVATQNQDSLRAFVSPDRSGKWISVEPLDQSAVIEWISGRRRKVEFSYGSTFYSQSSRRLFVDDQVKRILITDTKGRERVIAF